RPGPGRRKLPPTVYGGLDRQEARMRPQTPGRGCAMRVLTRLVQSGYSLPADAALDRTRSGSRDLAGGPGGIAMSGETGSSGQAIVRPTVAGAQARRSLPSPPDGPRPA